MIDTSAIRRLSCYAVLNAGYSGENYLIPHMRLVLSLVSSLGMKKIDVKELVDRFYKEYQYSISFFPMKKILGLAVTQGYLEKKRNDRHFVPTEKLVEFKNVHNDISDSEREVRVLASAFQDYASKSDVHYSFDDVNRIIISYISNRKLVHMTGDIDSADGDKRTNYLFGKFVFELRAKNPVLFGFLTKMVVGSILADCLIFHEQIENGKSLEGSVIVFDTALVFMALGIDEAQRQEYYKSLIETLREKGAKVIMFTHSYNEMQYVITGAADWMENPQYDASKASETAAYFKSINATRSEVIEYSDSLKNRIIELGIVIEDYHYDESLYKYQEDENKIYSLIVQKYAASNPYFNEQQQKRSMELDAKSLSLIYLMRRGQMPMRIADCGYLFVTANSTLNRVANEYHTSSGKLERSLPSSVTDVFLGTYLWLNDPRKIVQMNEMMIISHAYLAFQPNGALLKKLSDSLKRLMEKGTISSDACYALMGNKMVLDRLAEKTLGDPEAFTESTPLEVLKEMIEDGRREEREKATAELEAWKALSAQEKAAITEQYEKNNRELVSDFLVALEISLETIKKQIRDARILQKRAERCRKRWKCCVVLLSILWLMASLYIGIKIWQYDLEKNTNWLDLLSYVITAIITAIPFIVTCILQKEISFAKSITKFLDKRYAAKAEKLGCTDEEMKSLQEQYKRLKKQKEVYEKKLEAA